MAVQGLVGCITGDWAYGAAIACTFFVAREYTQAEYRWIKRFGDGHRHKMPWWGGFDPHAWDGDLTLIGHLSFPFVLRGGDCFSGSSAGVLYSNVTNGYPSLNVGFRAALVV